MSRKLSSFVLWAAVSVICGCIAYRGKGVAASSAPAEPANPKPLPGAAQHDAAVDETGYDGELSTSQAGNMSSADNSTNRTTTTTHTPTTTKRKTTEVVDEQLPDIGSAEEEHSSSMALFFILAILGLCILLTHLLIKLKFHYLPESVAVVCLGLLLGLIILALKHTNISDHDFSQDEILDPTLFFLILLPPIIFESGYSLHKGNFFQNIGSILVFAIFGTLISTLVVGGGVYLLGKAKVAYELTLVESFAFGSLISAVDPVATLAIFSALDVHPLLNMLVFGESILNDAVSIVLSNTVINLNSPEMAEMSALSALGYTVGSFCLMFFASSLIGIAVGLISALLLKHIDLRNTPSLEFGLMLIFAYLPYALAEGVKLSGIMAILFCGIVMSHYTHYNLSPVTQINMQHSFRTMAFLAETCVFAYLGMAIPSFNHRFETALVLWSIVLILLGRALNIFPLSFLCNKFREHKITFKMQFVMWFSGLRGAIAYALSMHLEFGNDTRHVLVTTTLTIVLFTVLGLGGSTLPLLKCIGAESGKSKKEVSLSKTEEMGSALDAEHLSELTEEEYEVNYIKPGLKGFVRWDTKYLTPFFTRRFTNKELRDGRVQMRQLTNRWYSEVRGPASDTEDETELIGN
ncbi:sodium/hydrogen exchanger 8-like [Diadema antillarum]|uniref:sodium/hydrogen exchanger 8-like n=1 Tax=Diadema antillarum TaxID=105358 RepID=UPI003A89B363